jgi:hypothetical protein
MDAATTAVVIAAGIAVETVEDKIASDAAEAAVVADVRRQAREQGAICLLPNTLRRKAVNLAVTSLAIRINVAARRAALIIAVPRIRAAPDLLLPQNVHSLRANPLLWKTKLFFQASRSQNIATSR